MLILKLESILKEIVDPYWDILSLYQVLFEKVEIDCQLIYQIVNSPWYNNIFLIYNLSRRIMHTFWLAWRVLNINNKKDFSLSF